MEISLSDSLQSWLVLIFHEEEIKVLKNRYGGLDFDSIPKQEIIHIITQIMSRFFLKGNMSVLKEDFEFEISSKINKIMDELQKGKFYES